MSNVGTISLKPRSMYCQNRCMLALTFLFFVTTSFDMIQRSVLKSRGEHLMMIHSQKAKCTGSGW